MKLALISLLVLLICVQLTVGLRKKMLKRKNVGGGIWKGKRAHLKKMKPNFGEASNPEMMVMMRMKKMLSPLRELFTKVLDLGPQEIIGGRPDFCGDSECPAFKVLNKSTHYELREYEESNWVSTSVVAPSLDSKVQSSLFWPLYNYIQGANSKRKTIKMTVPVTNVIRPASSRDGYKFTMSFFISPSVRHIPKPINNKVFIANKPGFKVYAHSFKGYAWNQKIWQRHVDMMSKFLDKDGLKGKYIPGNDTLITAGYNDPVQMFNRHNEVWLLAKH